MNALAGKELSDRMFKSIIGKDKLIERIILVLPADGNIAIGVSSRVDQFIQISTKTSLSHRPEMSYYKLQVLH